MWERNVQELWRTVGEGARTTGKGKELGGKDINRWLESGTVGKRLELQEWKRK